MDKTKVVVTGGAGLIGSWVVEYLLKDSVLNVDEIIVLDNFVRGTIENLEGVLKSGKVKIVRGDIRDKDLVNEICKGSDYIVHEAAIRITQCAEEPRLCNEVLVDGTFNIFEACVKNNVKKIVFNSSASVYGEPHYIPMDEDHFYNNDTFYGAAKIANEHMAKAFRRAYGMNYVCFRPFNVYGPRMDVFGVYTEVLIRWLDRIYDGLSPVLHGDGKQALDFIYVEDVARATVYALRSNVGEGVYNLGTGKSTDLNTLVKKILKLMGSNNQPVYEQQRAVAHVSRRKADMSRFRRELGEIIDTPLDKGLQRLIDWHKAIKDRKKETNESTFNQAAI